MNNNKLVTVTVTILLVAMALYYTYKFTVRHSAPVAMTLDMADTADSAIEAATKNGTSFTVILLKAGRYYCYSNKLQEGMQVDSGQLEPVLVKKKKEVQPADLMVAIKPSLEASYAAIVNMLDEMTITRIKRYKTTGLTPEETGFIKNLH